MPAVLSIGEGEGIIELLPEHERIDSGDRDRQGQSAESLQPLPLTPREHGEGGQQCDPGGTGEHGEACDDSRRGISAALGEEEREQRQKEEERLAVDRLQKERHRKDGEIQDRAPRAVLTEARFSEPMQEHERPQRRCQRDDDTGEDVVTEEDSAEHGDECRIERMKRGRGLVVAVFCDT